MGKDTINNWIIPFLSVGKRGFKSNFDLASIFLLILKRLKTVVQWRELPIESYFEKGGFLWLPFYSNAQDLDIEAITKDTKFRVSGGINADAMFFNSSAEKSTFTYMLTGSLNFSFLTFSMPVSYSITNQGNALNYKVPFDFNRFSIAPKYKWIKLYLGDHTLSLSPYTLNGHPFRGAGIELTPKGALKFSTMGGRLLKAVEEDKIRVD